MAVRTFWRLQLVVGFQFLVPGSMPLADEEKRKKEEKESLRSEGVKIKKDPYTLFRKKKTEVAEDLSTGNVPVCKGLPQARRCNPLVSCST